MSYSRRHSVKTTTNPDNGHARATAALNNTIAIIDEEKNPTAKATTQTTPLTHEEEKRTIRAINNYARAAINWYHDKTDAIKVSDEKNKFAALLVGMNYEHVHSMINYIKNIDQETYDSLLGTENTPAASPKVCYEILSETYGRVTWDDKTGKLRRDRVSQILTKDMLEAINDYVCAAIAWYRNKKDEKEINNEEIKFTALCTRRDEHVRSMIDYIKNIDQRTYNRLLGTENTPAGSPQICHKIISGTYGHGTRVHINGERRRETVSRILTKDTLEAINNYVCAAIAWYRNKKDEKEIENEEINFAALLTREDEHVRSMIDHIEDITQEEYNGLLGNENTPAGSPQLCHRILSGTYDHGAQGNGHGAHRRETVSQILTGLSY
jgi:hypothetical protein